MSRTDTMQALAAVTASLPGAEDRPGQQEMAGLVADAIEAGSHLIVEAGTGTGKTLAYLVPAIVAGKKTVISTATKALQDQLATKDLPLVAEQLALLGHDIDWAVLKGRSNYVCLQRLNEINDPAQASLELDELSAITKLEVKKLAEWAGETTTGDQADLDWNPSDTTWRSVSVGSDECPGAERCPQGGDCFAERARRRAQAADVIVVNTYLYGLNVGSDGAILPEHEVVVFDEAHVLEDIMSDTVGTQLSPGRFVTLGASVRKFLDDPAITGGLTDLGSLIREAIRGHVGQRLSVPLPGGVVDALNTAQSRLGQAGATIANIEPASDDARQRKLRSQKMITRTIEAVDSALAVSSSSVPYVAGSPESPRLEIAPLDVGPTLAEGVWKTKTAILASATIPSALADRVGLPQERTAEADVGSPFDYEKQAILYCAMHLPQPKSPKFRDAVADELIAMIEAAGGRTLALFTSWAAMDAAVEAVRPEVSVPIITQRDLPKPALVQKFAASTETCLFATTGMFQGVDVPGSTLSLVVIDKLPFPRPDDPLLSARREQLGSRAFMEIDVPRAATLLAQAAGRLIRTGSDKGVVAVLDSRLGSARYRWDIVTALPPMKRTRKRDEVEAFLAEINDAGENGAG